MKIKVISSLLVIVITVLFIIYVKKLSEEKISLVKKDPENKTLPEGIKKSPFQFKSNKECKSCHEEIWKEAEQDEHFHAWFNGPFFPQDPKRTECSSCHASQPILETGINNMAVVRIDRFDEGIGCIECHKFQDEVQGPLNSSEAACNPRLNKLFNDSSICNPCHAPHGSYDEWKSSEWFKKGVTCQACHMLLVDSKSSGANNQIKRRSHKMLGTRNIDFIRSAVTFDAKLANNKTIEISITNSGAGHSIPGEINNREMFLLVIVSDKSGNQSAEFRESFKTVRRQQRATEQATQIKSGETKHFSYNLDIEHGSAVIKLGYKQMIVITPDEDSFILFEKKIDF